MLSQKQELTVFNGLDLVIDGGSFVVIVGGSGCGKTTLLHLIAGLISPCEGTIFADYKPVEATSPARTILFQQPSLLPWLTVSENINFGCKLRGDTYKLEQRTQELVHLIGLDGFENTHPPELSTGMAQRVSLARALLGDPKVLLLDEPFASLDLVNRAKLQSKLTDTWRRQGFTAVLVTHDIDEALSLGQKILFLGGFPSSINAEITVNLPYPRDVTSTSFFEAKRDVINAFRKTMSLSDEEIRSEP